jgi:hypothetical protein
MATIKQEIKALKVGQEKIFKVDFESEYITIRKSKLKGLEIIIDDDTGTYQVSYEELKDNFTNFALYQETKIDY